MKAKVKKELEALETILSMLEPTSELYEVQARAIYRFKHWHNLLKEKTS